MHLNFKQIVLYGPLLHQHPDSWMFLGFQKAFVYKKYKVIWVNEERNELLNNYDLSNSLFITSQNHDENIPLRSDSFYILFKNTNPKYDGYNSLYLDLYSNDLPEYVSQWKNKSYIQYSLENRELYFPLATELVPQEILLNQQKSILDYPGNTRTICLLGNISKNGVSRIFADIKSNCIKIFYKLCIVNNMSSEYRSHCIRTCAITPVISSTNQINKDEIDYRVFQTISYGGFTVTNSEITRDLFDDNCIYYADNGKDLILGGIKHKNDYFNDQCKWKVMENIKNNHTFVKRVETIFWMLCRL